MVCLHSPIHISLLLSLETGVRTPCRRIHPADILLSRSFLNTKEILEVVFLRLMSSDNQLVPRAFTPPMKHLSEELFPKYAT